MAILAAVRSHSERRRRSLDPKAKDDLAEWISARQALAHLFAVCNEDLR